MTSPLVLLDWHCLLLTPLFLAIYLIVRWVVKKRDRKRPDRYVGASFVMNDVKYTIVGYDPTTKRAMFTPPMDKAPNTGDTFLFREEKP